MRVDHRRADALPSAGRLITRPARRWDAGHAGVLDTGFLAEQCCLLLTLIRLGGKTNPFVRGLLAAQARV